MRREQWSPGAGGVPTQRFHLHVVLVFALGRVLGLMLLRVPLRVSRGVDSDLPERHQRLRASAQRGHDALGQPDHGHDGRSGAWHGASHDGSPPTTALQAQLIAHQPYHVAPYHRTGDLPARASHVRCSTLAWKLPAILIYIYLSSWLVII